MEKNDWRKKYTILRSHFSESQIEDMSLSIANNALSLDIWQHTYYHVFLPISEKKEVNTEYLLHILQGKDKSIVVPKADFNTFEMQNILLQENTPIKISTYGIPEPISGIEIDPKMLDVVFVPLVAYDQKGNRIGYGKGFYDRLLANCKNESIFIGLSFFEPEKNIKVNSNDISLDFCVTPQKILKFS